ncbi:MAG TPA: kinase [Cyanobacteria bacterium UBA8803]|nr:kinase [Cyanobacteria bacterium UBA9273]HBL58143.1 kinase [Cyanobacteria bacterium UBA8803]
MEAVILIGLQAAGKSSFCRDRYFNTHIRINLDMLKTRHREKILVQACLTAKQPFVVDNTNPTPEDRARYIIPAKEKRFRVVGYYFQSVLEDCKRRNAQRQGTQVIPLPGILVTYKKLVLPRWDEGFDALYYVKLGPNHSFIIKEWSHEISEKREGVKE